MAAIVVNTNGVHFADAVDSDYVVVREGADVEAIIGDMLGDDIESLDDATVSRVSVSILASIAAAAAEYLSAQVNRNFDYMERGALVLLLVEGGYGTEDDFVDDDEDLTPST